MSRRKNRNIAVCGSIWIERRESGLPVVAAEGNQGEPVAAVDGSCFEIFETIAHGDGSFHRFRGNYDFACLPFVARRVGRMEDAVGAGKFEAPDVVVAADAAVEPRESNAYFLAVGAVAFVSRMVHGNMPLAVGAVEREVAQAVAYGFLF